MDACGFRALSSTSPRALREAENDGAIVRVQGGALKQSVLSNMK